MNINASIIDQRLVGVSQDIRSAALELGRQYNDEGRLKSLAFVYLCVQTILDLDAEVAFDCLTEGGGDFGVDAMYLSEEVDGEFGVTLFQGKYKANLEGNSNFEENGVNALINAIKYIFDPSAQLDTVNDRLKYKVEEARSMIRDGLIPRVRAIACNNGLKWNSAAAEAIERSNTSGQVTWEYVNHDTLLSILQRTKPIDEMLRFTGKAIVEDMHFSRVCIGRIPVSEILALMKKHGDALLERNIRRYLGHSSNRVNEGIRTTLRDAPENFYFFNNGLTLVCNDFSYNALQSSDYQISLENLQIVNGGQTCMTIFKVLEEMGGSISEEVRNASVLVRIYKLPKDNEDIVLQITHATNSQNPVDLKDLKSNDSKQKSLESSIAELGFTYKRKRTEVAAKHSDITSGAAAEAVLSVWRSKPHQAKFLTREHFGKLYDVIFSDDLNGTQVVIAVLLYRIAENRRKRPRENDPTLVRYASCFIAMCMGGLLLKDLNVGLSGLTHQNFGQAQALIEAHGDDYFKQAVAAIESALSGLYGASDAVSLQQLSATFRRGDLITILNR